MAETKLKLEVGKKYRTRNGEVVEVTAFGFRGWSCVDTPCCVFRIPLPNAEL
jgi:hypothetical protein